MKKKVSRGNFYERIYHSQKVPKSAAGEINRIDYENPTTLIPYFKSHPAYFSDFVAFQHIELWLKGLTMKNGVFSSTNSNIPLVISCRAASNRQRLGLFNFYLGNVTYNISDFNTSERISSDKTLINKNLPKLFEEGTSNGVSRKDFRLSMQENYSGRNLFEIILEDEKENLSGRLLFKNKIPGFENGYAEVLNSGEYPAFREFMSKRWFELIGLESFIKYNGQELDLSGLSSAFVDEASGFSPKKKNWDWMIFKSEDEIDDVRLILRKKCKRAGYGKENEIATFFMNGKIYRINGEVDFDYNVGDLTKPWKASLYSGKNNRVEIVTDFVAPFVEKSSMNKEIGPIKVRLDLQRVIAETSIEGRINGKKIKLKGIGSFESNKGMERGTKYFKD